MTNQKTTVSLDDLFDLLGAGTLARMRRDIDPHSSHVAIAARDAITTYINQLPRDDWSLASSRYDEYCAVLHGLWEEVGR